MKRKCGVEIDEIFKYKIFMCSKCEFYIDKKCIKQRKVQTCAKLGLKNK